ncbi:MAG: hypothetical protein LBR51_07270 [Bacteroidales bacterium]|jgi:hypothetical protein|nr:hypothetical protein [Bacteroidales bacterium]
MRKLSLVLLAVGVAAMFGSCQKEGVYKPKKMISKIYEASTLDQNKPGEKLLSETWTWTDKQLTQIAYGESQDLVAKITYDDKKRISKVTTSDGETIVFTYDDKEKLLTTIVATNSNVKQTYTIEHKDKEKLIKKITIKQEVLSATTAANAAKNSVLSTHLVQSFFPNIDLQILETAKSAYLIGNSTLTKEFYWDGENNINTEVQEELLENSTDPKKCTITYQYDKDVKGKNPFYHSLYFAEELGTFTLTKNNVTKAEKIESGVDGTKTTITNTYTYDDDEFPVSVKSVQIFHTPYQNQDIATYIDTYYEYLEK